MSGAASAERAEFVPCITAARTVQHYGLRADWKYGNRTLCGKARALDQSTVNWFANRGGLRRFRGVVVADLPMCRRCTELEARQRGRV